MSKFDEKNSFQAFKLSKCAHFQYTQTDLLTSKSSFLVSPYIRLDLEVQLQLLLIWVLRTDYFRDMADGVERSKKRLLCWCFSAGEAWCFSIFGVVNIVLSILPCMFHLEVIYHNVIPILCVQNREKDTRMTDNYILCMPWKDSWA